MVLPTKREAFIPYRRSDLIDLCIEDRGLGYPDILTFPAFCELLAAYYHVKAHRTLEKLKDNYAPFNPDADTRPRATLSSEKKALMETNLMNAMEVVLQRANYIKLEQADLDQAMQEEALIPLRTKVNFADFESIVCYYRGGSTQTITHKQWFRTKQITFENLERVALLLKFKDSGRSAKKKSAAVGEQSFTPGKIYLYLYKNIPKMDLELLFPNVKVSMSIKDMLLFIVPAMGAAIPLLLKILPSLGLIVGVIVLLAFGPEVASRFNIDADSQKALFTVLIALLSVGAALGGFAMKQYTSYKHKCLQFTKRVADTLFFNNLVSNRGVLHTLVDAAEEEETKEIILIYYHLLRARDGLTRDELDERIEQWLEKKFRATVDFDIDKALHNLLNLHQAIDNSDQDNDIVPRSAEPLLRLDDSGRYYALPLEHAQALLDDVWDRIFEYDLKTVKP